MSHTILPYIQLLANCLFYNQLLQELLLQKTTPTVVFLNLHYLLVHSIVTFHLYKILYFDLYIYNIFAV